VNVELVAVGDIGVDLVTQVERLPEPDEKVWVDELTPCPGGMAANVAAAYASLGGTAAVLGRVGRDGHGELSRQDLERRGVDTSLVQVADDPTFWSLALATPDGDRCLIQFPTAALWPDVTPDVLDEVRGAPLVHTIAEQGEAALVVAEAAARSGALVSCDIESPAVRRPDLDVLVAALDVAFVNSGAVADLTGDPETTADELRGLGASTVCVTMGGDGALVVGDDGATRIAPHRVDVVDSTGAGDAFAGGFLWARHRGCSGRAAGEIANALAAVSATGPGRHAVGDPSAVTSLLDGRDIELPGLDVVP
jgi:sugar/nucleoside kinase (ribokinase family)